MRIGFSSSVWPEWDLEELVRQAKAFGFDMVELRGLQGHLHLPTCPALSDPARVKDVFATTGVELICIGTDCSLEASDRRTLADQKTRLREALTLAASLGCPNVRMRSGDVPAFRNRDGVLGRIVAALREVAPQAAEQNTTILVENDGNLATSRDLWYIVDAAGHPSVRCRWNPCRAILAGDNHGLAVPRIGRMTSVVTMVDAVLTQDGRIDHYTQIGQGTVDLARFLTLMQGLGSDADLVVGSPPDSGAKTNPSETLPAAAAWIKEQLAKLSKAPELTAYKGDKNAPRFVPRTVRAMANG